MLIVLAGQENMRGVMFAAIKAVTTRHHHKRL
jgi:hypothetical protein